MAETFSYVNPPKAVDGKESFAYADGSAPQAAELAAANMTNPATTYVDQPPEQAPTSDAGVPMQGTEVRAVAPPTTREGEYFDATSGLDPHNKELLASLPGGSVIAPVVDRLAKMAEVIPAGIQYGANKVDDALGMPLLNTPLDMLNAVAPEGSMATGMVAAESAAKDSAAYKALVGAMQDTYNRGGKGAVLEAAKKAGYDDAGVAKIDADITSAEKKGQPVVLSTDQAAFDKLHQPLPSEQLKASDEAAAADANTKADAQIGNAAGTEEDIDFGPKGIQPVTTFSTADLKAKLAAEQRDRFTVPDANAPAPTVEPVVISAANDGGKLLQVDANTPAEQAAAAQSGKGTPSVLGNDNEATFDTPAIAAGKAVDEAKAQFNELFNTQDRASGRFDPLNSPEHNAYQARLDALDARVNDTAAAQLTHLSDDTVAKLSTRLGESEDPYATAVRAEAAKRGLNDEPPVAAAGGNGGGQPPVGTTGTGDGSFRPDQPQAPGPFPEGKYAANINTERLGTTEQTEQHLRAATQNLDLTNVTNQENVGKARAVLNNNDPLHVLSHDPKESEIEAYSIARRAILRGSLDNMGKAADDILDPAKNTTKAEEELEKWRIMTALASEKVSGGSSVAGRLLQSHKIDAGSKGMAEAIQKMSATIGQKGSKEFAKEVAAYRDNPEAQAKLASDSIKPRFEDYVTHVWYNLVLSGIHSAAKNFLDGGLNHGLENVTHGVAALIGTPIRKAFGLQTGVTGTEVAARVYGDIRGLMSLSNMKDIVTTFKQSRPVTGVSKAEEAAHMTLPWPFKVIEFGPRNHASADQFWRGIIQSSDYYGMAAVKAQSEGLSGKALLARVDELVKSPTKDMLQHTQAAIERQQFVDEPGTIVRAIQSVKQNKPNMTVPGRLARFGATMTFPFPRVADSMLRTMTRYSPAGFFEAVNKSGLKAGGRDRDLALARMAIGTSGIVYFVNKALTGGYTGNGPSDYTKRKELEAGGWQANSIVRNGVYKDISGTTAGITANLAASAAEQYHYDQANGATVGMTMSHALKNVAHNLSDSTWFKGVGDLANIQEPGSQGDSAWDRYWTNMGNSFTVPAAAREISSAVRDGKVSDTRGGSIHQNIWNKIKDTYGLDTFSSQYDSYGNPIDKNSQISPTRSTPDDPAIRELHALAVAEPKTIVSPVGTSVKLTGGISRKLLPEEQDNYQRMVGNSIVAGVQSRIDDGTWAKADQATRVATVKQIQKDARVTAKTQLFETPTETFQYAN